MRNQSEPRSRAREQLIAKQTLNSTTTLHIRMMEIQELVVKRGKSGTEWLMCRRIVGRVHNYVTTPREPRKSCCDEDSLLTHYRKPIWIGILLISGAVGVSSSIAAFCLCWVLGFSPAVKVVDDGTATTTRDDPLDLFIAIVNLLMFGLQS